MTYEQAKAQRDALYEAMTAANVTLVTIPGVGTGPMGLTPDAVRATPEWQAAKRASELAFAKVRAFNTIFVKQFRLEIRAERNARLQRVEA